MQATIKNSNDTKTIFILTLLACLALMIEPALAQGGLDKPKTLMDNVIMLLQGLAIGVCTIAIMWSGYKLLFQHADKMECAKILGGGLLIGGAAEIASWVLS